METDRNRTFSYLKNFSNLQSISLIWLVDLQILYLNLDQNILEN